MGVVYEAEHTVTGRRVAVKLLRQAGPGNDEAFARFQREARVAGSIDSPHIAQVLDAGRDPTTGWPFMVMELLAGEDLGQTATRLGPLPVELALRIVAQACAGLAKAHASGVVHRDIKPANLYLTRRDGGEVLVKVVDFGIAKLLPGDLGASAHSQETRTGSILGTPQYMAPEQAKGLKSIDHRADVWSMGAVLYRLLTGRTPHADVDTLGQLVVAICTEEPLPVQEFAPWVPAEVAAITHGALRIDPRARFQTAAAMLEAIRALLPGGTSTLHESLFVPLSPAERAQTAPRGVVVADPGRLPSLPDVPPTAPGRGSFASSPTNPTSAPYGALTSTVALPPAPPPRRKVAPIVLAAAGVLVALVGGVFVFFAARGGEPTKEPARTESATPPPPPTPAAANPLPSAVASTLAVVAPASSQVAAEPTPTSKPAPVSTPVPVPTTKKTTKKATQSGDVWGRQ